jgi:hypothetical protein
MDQQVTGTRRGGKPRAARLENIAVDPAASHEARAQAITELAQIRRWLPPHLVQIRRDAVAAMHAAGHRQADIARALNLKPYAGRVNQILRAHREAGRVPAA